MIRYMEINWNLWKEMEAMQSNFHLDAYEVDAVTQQGRPVRFDITDGCNGKYLIHTEHDQLYVDKSVLIKVMQLIENEKAGG